MKKFLFFLAAAFYLNTNAQNITTVVGGGNCGAAYCGDGGQATAAKLNQPNIIAFDISGNMYVADEHNYCIRIVNSVGIITTVAGNGTGGYSGDGGPATAAKFNNPSAVALDAMGNLYIADNSNNYIRKVNSSGIVSPVVGIGINNYSGDGGPATAAALNTPASVTFDAIGNMYIADYFNNRIRKVNTAGIITTIAGNGTHGFSGDGGQATAAELYSPSDVAFDAAGNLYIADSYNNRIRIVNTSGIISTIAGNGFGAGTGSGGFSGDGGQATAAELALPFGIALDASGNLFIGDALNHRVRKVNTQGIISTVAGNGTGAYSGDGGSPTAAELYYPGAIDFDASGNMYITDAGNNRIRMVNYSASTDLEQTKNNNNQLNIYPNPIQTNFTIETNTKGKKTMVFLFDINGKLVLNQFISDKTIIDVNSLSAGMYSLNVTSNEGTQTKKLVIVK